MKLYHTVGDIAIPNDNGKQKSKSDFSSCLHPTLHGKDEQQQQSHTKKVEEKKDEGSKWFTIHA